MHAKDILIDGYNRIREEVHAAVGGLAPDQLGARPASVSVTLRVVRTNSGVCSSRSSARIEADSPDWDTISRSAARVKCWSSATATKC